MDDSSKHINIYLSPDDKSRMDAKKVESPENMSQAYLIQSYDKMRREFDTLKIELGEKTRECETLEEDNERMEKTVTNIKGFVKNLGEMYKKNDQLKKRYSKFQNETSILLADSYNTIYRLVCDKVCTLLTIMGICLILWYFNCMTFSDIVFTATLDLSLMAVSLYTFRLECSYIKDIRVTPNIKDTKYHILRQKYMPVINDLDAELTELEKGNEFLNDLIDMQ